MNTIEQIKAHLNRLGLLDCGPVDSIVVYEVEQGIVRIADDHGEWVGPASVALELLAEQETLSWEEFWELFQD